MRAGPTLVLCLLGALSCKADPDTRKQEEQRASKAQSPSSPPPGEIAAAPLATPGKPLAGKLSRCGWGVVGQGQGTEPPPWMIALVDAVAVRDVVGLRVLLAELYAGDAPVTKGSGEASILLQESGGAYSFSAAGTRELGGTLPEGASRLRVATRVEGTMKALLGKKPDRCRLVLTDENGDNLVVEGALDPVWEMQQ